VRRRLGILGASLGLLGAAAAPVDAAVVSGSNLSNPPSDTLCATPSGTNSCTTTIAALPMATRAPGGPTVGIDGVIVAWSLRAGASSIEHKVRLRIVRGTTGSGSGAVEMLPKAAGTYSFPARLPVQQGDFLGVDTLEVPAMMGVPIIRTFGGSFLDFWNPALGEGDERAPTTNDATNLELLMNATIEPDADNDGYGDETQDKCAGKADPTNTCPPDPGPGGGAGGGGGSGGGNPIPIEPEPNTKIVRFKLDGAKATFRFTGSEKGVKFQCTLNKKPWKQCKSPKVYSGLKEGRHTFKVKAIGTTAVPDPTPAKRTFRVEP